MATFSEYLKSRKSLPDVEFRFMEENSIYPYEVDLARISEQKQSIPVDHWNYKLFNDVWYPVVSKIIKTQRLDLLRDRLEWGIHFKNLKEVTRWMDEELDKPTYFYCDTCDFKSECIEKLNRHIGTNACRLMKLKLDCKKNKDLYIPPHKNAGFCVVCNKHFLNKYSLERHNKSPLHRENLNVEPKPTHCMVCKCAFDVKNLAKTRRHLKSSKKCHRIAAADKDLFLKWSWMYSRFSCKFNKKVLQSEF